MVLRLDPRLPLVWRSPESLQLGVDRPRVVLREVTEAQERMVAALVKGVSRSGLTVIAKLAGADDAEAARLLLELKPALLVDDPPSTSGQRDGERDSGDRVALVGRGDAMRRLGDGIAAAGLLPHPVTTGVGSPRSAADPAVSLAVLVADYVIEPDQHGYWLRRDVPHLTVVFGDSSVRIGPVVEPGRGPCLYCLERARTDADPSWPAIASQLWGRRSPIHGGLVAAEAAATASRLVVDRLRNGPAEVASAIRLDAATGLRTVEGFARHPACGCSALPGTATVAAAPDGSAPSPPRTTAGATAPS